MQQAFPEAAVELWATDQRRVGLKPIVRRIWVRKGTRPRVVVQQRFQWLYVYSFVHPASGKTEWLLLPTVTAEVFTIALAHFAQAVGVGPTKQVLLVLDQAGWHTSKELGSWVGIWSEPILPDTEESQLPGTGVKAASNSAGGRYPKLE